MVHEVVSINPDCSYQQLYWPSRHAAMSLVSPMKQHMSLMRMLLSARPSNPRLLDKDMSENDHLNRDELRLTRGIVTVLTQHNSRDTFEMPLGDKDHASFSKVRHESHGPHIELLSGTYTRPPRHHHTEMHTISATDRAKKQRILASPCHRDLVQ
jgi:hypothetical protein